MSKNSPELRFQGFTDDWEQRKFEDLLDSKDGVRRGPFGGALKKEFFVENSEYVVYEQQNAIYDNYHTRYKITKEKFDELSKFKLNPGDFIMSGAGTIGRISRVPDGVKLGVFNQALIRFRINPEITDSEYFIQFVRADFMQKNLTCANPGSAITNLVPMSEVKKWEIKAPHLEEQKKIGSFFKQLDDTIALHQRKLDLLKEQKKGFLQKMFPKNGAKVPELRFAGFADDWEERKLENIAQINKGIQRGKQEISSVRNELNPYPVYNGGKKASGYTDEYNRENSVMVSEGGASAGYVNYYSGKYWSGGHNFTISNDTKHDTFFLLYVLQKSQEKLYKLQVGTGLPNIQLKSIKDFPIYSTSNTEQQKIGSFFQQLDDTIVLHQRKLDLLKEQKKGFLQKMFV